MKEMEQERINDEAALKRAAHLEAIGNLAGGIAHDFSNLLQIQLGNISLIEDEEGLSPDIREALEDIENAAYKEQRPSERSGLGLSIAYSTVSRHDGHMTLHSESDIGTTVDILLHTTP